MKITVYELLGLVKDGKAPKKIKYEENIYKYLNREYFYGYYTGEGLLYDLFDDKDVFRILNDKVEILEEKNKKIKKLDIWDRYTNHKNLHTYMQLIDDKDDKEKTFCISTVQKEIIVKLHEVIDAINERGEKNDK